jgi:1-acyl-sn-glycerol-3-phosphate acyltransferase
MYRDFDVPVVPVATNLGLFWPQQTYRKHPGTAVLEFLDPIPPGLDRTEFMARLQDVVETRSQALIAEATGQPVGASVLVATPGE